MARIKRKTYCHFSWTLPKFCNPIRSRDPIEELSEPLARAVLSLPPIYKRVVVLYYLQGLSTKEVAIEIGISKGGVEWRLFNARKLLEKKIKAKEPHL
jgi:RNA polymerase sigma factor (sigma-70 family)